MRAVIRESGATALAKDLQLALFARQCLSCQEASVLYSEFPSKVLWFTLSRMASEAKYGFGRCSSRSFDV